MKISEELVKDLVQQVEEGSVSMRALVAKNGIHRNTAMNWRNHGKKLLEMFDNDREKTLNHIYKNATKNDRNYSIGCVMFVTDLPAALATLQVKLEKVVLDEGLREPKMALNILERIAPEEWAKRVHVESTVETRQITTIIENVQEQRKLEEQNPIDVEFSAV